MPGSTPATRAAERRRTYRLLEENERRLCDVPACGRYRSGLAHYCAAHSKRVNKYGTPTGQELPRDVLLAYSTRADRFLARFADHQGVQAAHRLMRLVLDAPHRFTAHLPTLHELAAVADRGLRDEGEALRLVLTVFLIFKDGVAPECFSGGRADDPLRFQLAHAVLLSRPRLGKHVWTDGRRRYRPYHIPRQNAVHREVGGVILKLFGPFMLGAARKIAAERDEQRALTLATYRPFDAATGEPVSAAR
jgi:hypothetical protein